jgi:transcription antitermination protein NusB
MVGMILSSDHNRLDEDGLKSSTPGSRRKARELALQGLYAMELAGNSVDKVMKDLFLFHHDDAMVKEFARVHIEKTHENQSEIDGYIRKYATNWDFDRIAIIDRIILRMAICEFLHFWDIPPKVSIDEAIELSKSYSTEQSSRFVNGILDAVLLDLKEHQQLVKVGRGLKEGHEEEGDATEGR